MKTTRGTPKTIEGAIENALQDALEEYGMDFIYHDVSGDKLVNIIRDHVKDFVAQKASCFDEKKSDTYIELFRLIFGENS